MAKTPVDFLRVGQLAVQLAADDAAARSLVNHEAASEFIIETLNQGVSPYVRATFGNQCMQRTSSEGDAEECPFSNNGLPPVPKNMKLVKSLPFESVMELIIEDEVGIDIADLAYYFLTGRHSEDDGISDRQLLEAVGMATEDSPIVRAPVTGHLELYSDQPFLSRFLSRFHSSLQGTDMDRVDRLRAELVREFEDNIHQGIIFASKLLEDMGDEVFSRALRSAWYDDPDLACSFLKFSKKVQHGRILPKDQAEWKRLMDRLVRLGAEHRSEEGR